MSPEKQSLYFLLGSLFITAIYGSVFPSIIARPRSLAVDGNVVVLEKLGHHVETNSALKGLKTKYNCPDNKLFGGAHSDPDDCQVFYNCIAGQAHAVNCGIGQAFDPKAKHCTLVKNVPRCSAFNCTKNGIFPDPASCTKYYFCISNNPYHFDCPKGDSFDAKAGYCKPSAGVKCSTGTPPTTTQTTTTTTTTVAPEASLPAATTVPPEASAATTLAPEASSPAATTVAPEASAATTLAPEASSPAATTVAPEASAATTLAPEASSPAATTVASEVSPESPPAA